MAKLSIIVPVYKVEPYLQRCVDSILAQTFTDFELILVDDGSPDRCGAICDSYAEKDSRIRVIHKENGGLSDARNAGLDMAQGEYVGFVDSDDYIHPCMYQRLMELMERYRADIIATGFVNVDQNGVEYEKYPQLEQEQVLRRQDFIDHFYPDNRWLIFASACNKLYRSGLFQNLRYPKGRLYEDSFTLMPLLEMCETIVVDREHHYCYFTSRDGSIMNDRYTKNTFQLMDLGMTQYVFFADRGLKAQQEYALADYVTKYMINFFAVYIAHKELIEEFKPYRKVFSSYFGDIMSDPQICKLKKLVIAFMYLNRKIAYRLSKQYFPESLPDFLRG